jgi:hypothetical protein
MTWDSLTGHMRLSRLNFWLSPVCQKTEFEDNTHQFDPGQGQTLTAAVEPMTWLPSGLGWVSTLRNRLRNGITRFDPQAGSADVQTRISTLNADLLAISG